MATDRPTTDLSVPNPGYAASQLSRALTTWEQHEDDATRERARLKAEKWVRVLDGLLSGKFAVGTRQPMSDIPVWATPEVLTGGFVTGRLLAGGPLQPHEKELAARIGVDASDDNRAGLNAWFLSEPGFSELDAILTSGCYEIQVPEEGALPVLVWLARNGAAEEARELAGEITPYFDKLRFYPKPATNPMSFGSRIFLENVGTVSGRLRNIQPKPKILTQHEAIRIWTPHYEKMIGLFLETVRGEMPGIQPDAAGRWVCPESKRFYITGGWPCQKYPENWSDRARAAVAAIDSDRAKYKLCRRPDDMRDSFGRLLCLLRKCIDAPALLAGRDVGMVRLILARHVARYGPPGSRLHLDVTARRLSQTDRPTHDQIARIVAHRLDGFPADKGLEDTDELLQPVTAHECGQGGVPQGTKIPAVITRKVERCLCDTADALVERGIVTSGETLARVIPQFTAGLRASAFENPQLRALYAAIDRAFCRRRSLLLFNLEKQVRIEELPWVEALERRRRRDFTARHLARQTLEDVAALALRAFPHAIIPNKLLQEFRALTKAAELDVPFIEELAADIFMDDFSPKFTQAAKLAAAYVDGTIYAHYYGIDCAELLRLPDGTSGARRLSWFNREAPANPYAALCIRRAGAEEGKRWDVARNGMVIEQSQILTTHNLALLFGSLGLENRLKPHLRDMAENCFRWICRRQQTKTTTWHAKLIMLKQTAYAWRQMLFYVSRLSHEEIAEFIAWAEVALKEQSSDFRTRFAPALHGLALARRGSAPNTSPHAQCFLGWTQHRHWLLGQDSEASGE